MRSHFVTQQREFIRGVSRQLSPEVCELVPRIVATGVGVWLILPWRSFSEAPFVSPFGPLLRWLGLPLTEPYVGLFFLAYGVLGILALSMNWTRTRRFISLFGSFLWLWIVLVLLFRDPADVYFWFVLPLAFCSLFAFIYSPTWERRR
jgi:hypothetical protein